MKEERHAHLSELYLRAIELPRKKRRQFAAMACNGDTTLAAELHRMLSIGSAPGVLNTGAMAPGLDPFSVALPETIGPYRVLELLGQGGMGVVYRARQEEPIRREVAVKLIRLGIETTQIARRFEFERQVLARMNHPNIARVIDAGATEHGRSYVAMEYVDGVPINVFCDEHRLTIRERLELFVAVCEGVQHAHRNATIHRDLKPSNILVTIEGGRRVPKIIDFGVAKMLGPGTESRTLHTQLGQFVGTPEYMSPEQTSADSSRIDTRTDVYALGVLLYELMTGVLPFSRERLGQSDWSEIHRIIREDDPPTPSARVRSASQAIAIETARCRRTERVALRRLLDGDLDAITTKALEKEPDRRYGTAAELAVDIQRHLEHEPVSARPPSPAYRSKKYVRKHRVGVAAGSAVALAAIALTIVMGVSANRVAREHEKAAREADTAAALSVFIGGLFEVSQAENKSAHRSAPVDSDRLVNNLIAKIESLDGQPLLQATVLMEFGALQKKRGRAFHGTLVLKRAIERLSALKGHEDPATLKAKHHLAVALTSTYDYEKAEALFGELREAQERVLGPDHEDALLTGLETGMFYKNVGRYGEAVDAFERTLAGMRRVHGEQGIDTLVCASLLASVYLEQKRYTDTEALLLTITEPLRAALGENHLEYKAAVYNMAAVKLAGGEVERAIELLNSLPGSLPTDPLKDSHFAALWEDPRARVMGRRYELRDSIRRRMGYDRFAQLSDRGLHEEAGRILAEIVDANKQNLGTEHPETRASLHYLAMHYVAQGMCALPLLSARREHDRSRDDVPGYELDYLWYEAQCEIAERRPDQALVAIERALSLLGRVRLDGGIYRFYVAERLALSGDLDATLAAIERAIDIAPGNLGLLAIDRAFEPYRSDPRFRALVAELEEEHAGWQLRQLTLTGQPEIILEPDEISGHLGPPIENEKPTPSETDPTSPRS